MVKPPENNDFFLAMLAFFASVLYAIKNYDELKEAAKGARIRKLIYGMAGSALTTWTIYEILLYLGLPSRLCLALGGACGYLGAEIVSRIALTFIESRIAKKD